MRMIPVLLSAFVLAASCTSTPPAFLDQALSTVALGVQDSGRFVYHDSRAGFFGLSNTPSSEVLEASIARRRPPFFDLAGDKQRTLVLSVYWNRSTRPVSFQWECLYRATSVDRYETRGSYLLRPLHLPPDWDFDPFDTGRLDTLRALPVAVMEGRWKGHPVKILATRSFGMQALGMENGWESFVSEYQRFQIVDERGQVLGETSGTEGSLVRGYDYQVYDLVSPEEVPSMVAGLALVAALPLFIAATDEYRRGWSPDLGIDSGNGPGLKDWPLFD